MLVFCCFAFGMGLCWDPFEMKARSLPICLGAQDAPITTESGRLVPVWSCAWVWY